MAGPPDVAEDGFRPPVMVGTGLFTENDSALERPPPGAGLKHGDTRRACRGDVRRSDGCCQSCCCLHTSLFDPNHSTAQPSR